MENDALELIVCPIFALRAHRSRRSEFTWPRKSERDDTKVDGDADAIGVSLLVLALVSI